MQLSQSAAQMFNEHLQAMRLAEPLLTHQPNLHCANKQPVAASTWFCSMLLTWWPAALSRTSADLHRNRLAI
jgi:hypothetical protein